MEVNLGFIRGLLNLFRKKKPRPEPICCGGAPSEKKRRHKRKPLQQGFIEEQDYHIRGDLFRKLGISYDKPKREKKVRKIELAEVKEDKTRQMLYNRWNPLIRLLEDRGRIFISRNEYYGSIRGKDILRSAKRDLRRLGYSVEIELRDYDGYISLK